MCARSHLCLSELRECSPMETSRTVRTSSTVKMSSVRLPPLERPPCGGRRTLGIVQAISRRIEQPGDAARRQRAKSAGLATGPSAPGPARPRRRRRTPHPRASQRASSGTAEATAGRRLDRDGKHYHRRPHTEGRRFGNGASLLGSRVCPSAPRVRCPTRPRRPGPTEIPTCTGLMLWNRACTARRAARSPRLAPPQVGERRLRRLWRTTNQHALTADVAIAVAGAVGVGVSVGVGVGECPTQP